MNTSYHVGDAAEYVSENRRIFLGLLGIPERQLAIPQQRHTAVVKNISAPGTYEYCDALMTNVANVYLSVSVADCIPIFIYDVSKKAVACVHAGWRGSEQKIVEKTLQRMGQVFGTEPDGVLAFIGPAAGKCCYEVGAEVAQKFDDEFIDRRAGKLYLDLKQVNWQQLRSVGVADSRIERHKDCTICNPASYHSFRRDRERSGRMMGIIGLNLQE